MPELPEVETVRRGLQPVLEHHTITKAITRREDLRIAFPDNFAKRITGRYVSRLRRRAKYLILDLDSAESLVIHLGMSGRLSVCSQGVGRKLSAAHLHDRQNAAVGTGKHDHVVFETDAPARIVYTDHRRFGLMTLVETRTLEDHPLFASLGIEPLSAAFNAANLRKILAGKATPIKSALLDQRVVAGLGNIYACEALFRAGLSPKRLSHNVSTIVVSRLVAAIKGVLRDAIAAGGSSLRDHKQVNGQIGEFQRGFAVYGRERLPCLGGCGARVRRLVQGGRSTFYCPSCQK